MGESDAPQRLRPPRCRMTTKTPKGPLVAAPPKVPKGRLATTPTAPARTIIPPHTFSVPRRADQNAVASSPSETQLTVAALNDPVRICYGRVRIGAQITYPIEYGGDLLLPFVIARGRIDAVELAEFDDGSVGTEISSHLYYGVDAGELDAWLQSAWALRGRTYSDVLPGIAYGVLRIPPGYTRSISGLTLTIRGTRVYDPRDGAQTLGVRSTYKYSADPVLALADFLSNATYGKGETLDWASVTTCANVSDQTVSGSPRRRIGLVIDQVATLDEWEEALRGYAGVFIVREGGTVRLIPDAPAASVFSFTNAAGSANYIADSLQIEQRARRDAPTVVTVEWTDTAVTPWALRQHTEKAPGVESGTTPWRESVVQMPGIQSASQARRHALRLLNEYLIADTTVRLLAIDTAAQLRRGDVVSLTDGAGFSSKLFRLVEHRPRELGRWEESLVEYSSELYSDAVVDSPAPPDTNLPQPTSPVNVSSLTMTEEVYRVQTGLFASRWRVTWAEPVFPFVDFYEVALFDGPTLIDSGLVPKGGTEWTSKPIPENVTYTVTVKTISTVGAQSSGVSTSKINNGKQAKPTDVPLISGFEVSGEVRLLWTPATDLDLTGHEIRYSATNGSWSSATLIDRIAAPAVRYTTAVVPPGTWRFWIKGLDSVRSVAYPYGQESVNAAYCDITVTSDSDAFVKTSYEFVSPNTERMLTFTKPEGGTAYITNHSETWDSLFPSTMSTYTDVLANYHTAAASGVLGERYDIGVSISGDWVAELDYEVLSGTASPLLELNETGPEAAKNITNATNANPIVISCAGHGYSSGEEVEIENVGGNTAANGIRIVQYIDANSFSLKTRLGFNVAGSGAYTSGGTVKRWTWQKFPGLTAKTAARYVRVSVTTPTGTLLVNNPCGSMRVQVVTRREGGLATCSGSAGTPTVVELANDYTSVVSISASAVGSSGDIAVVDRVESSSGGGLGTGRVLRFNGSTTGVSVGDHDVHSFTNGSSDTDFTLEAWVLLDENPSAGMLIAGKTTWSVDGEWAMAAMQYGYWKMTLVDDTNGGRKEWLSVGYPLPIRKWAHWAFVYTGSTQSGQMYVNGAPISQQIATTGTFTRMRNTTHGLWFGRGGGANYLKGCIDEIRLWSVARTAQQMADNYRAALTSGTGLVGRWGFDEGSGSTAYDSTANAKNGTISGYTSGSHLYRPYDGFDLFRFNSAGVQTAGDVYWNFAGV